MRQYETAFLITSKLEEEETEKLIEKMAEVVKKKKGKMVNIERWGKRRLAYPIDKLDEAVYVFFHYEGEPDIPHELQRRFRQTETILRYLTLKKEPQTQLRKKAKTGRKGRTKTADEKAKIAEERAMEKKEIEETKAEPQEKTPEAPPEQVDTESEKMVEEKE
jgi:small subunit ribosomal protein S6